MKSVSIILPTYNEAGNIAKLIRAINAQSDLKIFRLEFIVVDDHSPDNTAAAVKKLIDQKLPIRLFVRIKKRGLATAIGLGIKKSTGNLIVLMDSDFNHQPQDIGRLIAPVVSCQADLVIGSRYIPGGGMPVSEANRLQFFLSQTGNFLINHLLLNLPIHESLSGFVAFKRSILSHLKPSTIFQGYGDYCIRLLYQAHRQGFNLKEIPVIYGQRQYGQSKSKLFQMMFNYFFTAVKLRLK